MSKTHYPVGAGGCFGGCGDNTPYQSKIEAANVCFDPAGSCNEGSDKPIVSTNLQAAMHELICQFNCLEDVYVASAQLANGILTFHYNNTNMAPFQVDLGSLNDIYVNGGNYNPATMVLTLSDNDGTTPDVTLDLSTLISAMTDNGNGTYTHSAGGVSTVIDTTVATDATIDGDGVNTPLSVNCAAIVANCNLATTGDIVPASSLIDNGDGTYTHTNGNGVVTVINTNTPHTASNVVNNGDGTYTHTNSDGDVTVIDTNTSHVPSTMVDNGNGTYTFNNGDGQVLLIDATQTHSSIVNNNDGTFTHTNGDNVVTTIDMCAACPDVLTSITYQPGDNTFTYTDELGGTSVIPLYPIDINVQNASLNGLVLTITETDGQVHNVDLSSLASNYTANPDGSYTLTSINGSVTIPAPTLPSSLTGASATGNTIGTHNDGQGNSVDINETVTTMVTNPDNSITFTSEDGTSTTIPADSVSSITSAVNADGSTTYTHFVNGVNGDSWTILPNPTVVNINDCVTRITDPANDTSDVQRVEDEAGFLVDVDLGSQVNLNRIGLVDINGDPAPTTGAWFTLAEDLAAGSWTNPSTSRSAMVQLIGSGHLQIAGNMNFISIGNLHGVDLDILLRVGTQAPDKEQLSYAVAPSDIAGQSRQEVDTSQRALLLDHRIVAPGATLTYGYTVRMRQSFPGGGQPSEISGDPNTDHFLSVRYSTPKIKGSWNLI